jgi:hypothetical protein
VAGTAHLVEGEDGAFLAPVHLGLRAGQDLEPPVQPGHAVVVVGLHLGGDARPGLLQKDLHPLVGGVIAVQRDEAFVDHTALERDVGPQPASITAARGAIRAGGLPRRDDPRGGTPPVFRYFFTVRQSQPTSAAISAYVTPASRKDANRLMFIQDSKSRIMEQSPFG